MAKILLAEDDVNLREIFEMRLKAEGYDVVTAGDGEEALVVAAREKPDLAVIDVMMPKISGFEMLETLRANPETANVKAIMMTALGQAEDRDRGQKLGVLKYLVKSQVTLEDFVRTIHGILDGNQNNKDQRSNMDPNNQTPATPAPDQGMPADASTAAAAAAPAPAPMPEDPAAEATAQAEPMAQETAEVNTQAESFTPPATEPAPAAPEQPAASAAPEAAPMADSSAAPAPGTTVEPTGTDQPQQ